MSNNAAGSGNMGGGGGPGSNSNVKPDIFSDQNAAPLTLAEEQSVRSMIAEEDLDRSYDDQIETAHRKMWLHFQAAASSLTHLYREREQLNRGRRSEGGSEARAGTGAGAGAGAVGRSVDQTSCDSDNLWTPFQNAAGNLTTLYRESWDSLLRPSVHLARKSGYQRARKELASWARSRRRCIRREELLAVLASMNSHPPDFRPQPLLGVEELLQAATVNEQPQSESVGAATAPEQLLLRSLKRPLPSPPQGGRATPSPQSDVNMSDYHSPVFKKPRQT